jgi:hypothetical protein
VDDLYDRRAGTEFIYKLPGGVGLVGAYLYRNQEWAGTSADENRLTAGVTYPLIRGRKLRVQGTTLYERHLVETEPHFNRYRQRFEISQPGRSVSPWIYQDFTFRQDQGFIRSRSRLGLRWRQRSGYTIKVAYQFESIASGSAWVPRHSIFTEASFTLAPRGE